jgi:hypothetical protein
VHEDPQSASGKYIVQKKAEKETFVVVQENAAVKDGGEHNESEYESYYCESGVEADDKH